MKEKIIMFIHCNNVDFLSEKISVRMNVVYELTLKIMLPVAQAITIPNLWEGPLHFNY